MEGQRAGEFEVHAQTFKQNIHFFFLNFDTKQGTVDA